MTPEHHLFDFRQPNLVQEFKLVQDSYLLIEFSLLVKGANSAGIFSFFFKMDPGFDVYIGNVKVFNFKQHGINDEKWHKYRLTMNKTEQLQHLKESGLSNLLVTINVRSTTIKIFSKLGNVVFRVGLVMVTRDLLFLMTSRWSSSMTPQVWWRTLRPLIQSTPGTDASRTNK